MSVQMLGPWVVGKSCGKGSFSQVRLCHHSVDGKVAVVKTTQLDMDPQKRLKQKVLLESEIATLVHLDGHPNIVRLYDVIETTDAMHVILEHINGVELFDFLTSSQGGRVGEAIVQHIMYQLLSTLEYMHTRNVLHRDIKLDNIMIDPVTLQVKLIDFNLSTFFLPGQSSFTMPVGCIHYSSPAILEACKTQEASYGDLLGHCDVWALGVACFGLLQSYFPFKQTKPERLLQEIKSSRGKLLFPHRISPTAQHFVSTILDPLAAPTAADMLRHPWILPCTLKALNNDAQAVVNASQDSMVMLRRGVFTETLTLAQLPCPDTMLEQALERLENYSRLRLMQRQMIHSSLAMDKVALRSRQESGSSVCTIVSKSSGVSVGSDQTVGYYRRGLEALGMY